MYHRGRRPEQERPEANLPTKALAASETLSETDKSAETISAREHHREGRDRPGEYSEKKKRAHSRTLSRCGNLVEAEINIGFRSYSVRAEILLVF